MAAFCVTEKGMKLTVSGPTCHYPNPYNKKKPVQTENQQLFLDATEIWGFRTNCHPESGQTGEYGESQSIYTWGKNKTSRNT